MTLRNTTSPAAEEAHQAHPRPVDFLILGAGWTYQFLQPLLDDPQTTPALSHAATTTTGRNDTIPFTFDPAASPDALRQAVSRLPSARVVLVTFPLTGRDSAATLVGSYEGVHQPPRWILLGSTRLWSHAGWNDRHSAYDGDVGRGQAEDELIARGGCVLDLAGLYGGERDPRRFWRRVARGSKDALAALGAVHWVHGADVARGVVRVAQMALADKDDDEGGWERKGVVGRWIVCDLNVYDWWVLVWNWAGEGEENPDVQGREQYRKWLTELMAEKEVRALPRELGQLGRKLDGREFWEMVGLQPSMSLLR